jgi:CRP/FNR family transcriptional regulator, cyclic AMP receptor protein
MSSVMMLETSRVSVLRRVVGLRHLSADELAALAERATDVCLQRGEVVHRADQPCSAVVVVVDGCAALYRDGRQVGEVGPGELIAGKAPLDILTRGAEVVAQTAMRLLMLPHDAVQATLSDTAVTAAFVHSAMARLRQEN